MTRSTSALFVPLFESVTLSLICFFSIHAFFASTVPSDYSPAMRSVLFSSLVLNIVTCFLHLVISAAQKTDQIVSLNAEADDESGRPRLVRVLKYWRFSSIC